MPSPRRQSARAARRELETILTSFDTSYAWNYGSVKEGLRDLYEKAKRDQWNGTEQLAWDTAGRPRARHPARDVNPLTGYAPYEKLEREGERALRHAQVALQLSQFLHGEQGALIVASQLVGAVPWIDAKYYAGTQTMDEARHVEVFSRYLNEKLEWQWPINDEPEGAARRDHQGQPLGLQVPRHADHHRRPRDGGLRQPLPDHAGAAAEGADPLRDADESRHVAFGVLSLTGLLPRHAARTSSATARTSSSTPASSCGTA